MRIDIGFADVVTPGPVPTDYPVILDLPAPRLSGYPRETVAAEKFEALVKPVGVTARPAAAGREVSDIRAVLVGVWRRARE